MGTTRGGQLSSSAPPGRQPWSRYPASAPSGSSSGGYGGSTCLHSFGGSTTGASTARPPCVPAGWKVEGTSTLWKDPKSGYINNMNPPNHHKHPHMALLKKDEWQSIAASQSLPRNTRNPMWAVNGPRPVELPGTINGGYKPPESPDTPYPTGPKKELGHSRNQKKNPDAARVYPRQNTIDPRIYDKVKVKWPVEAENGGKGPAAFTTTMKQHYTVPPKYPLAVDWIDPRVTSLAQTAFVTDRADSAWGLMRPREQPVDPDRPRCRDPVDPDLKVSVSRSMHQWRRPRDADPSLPVEPYNYMHSSLPGPTGVSRLFAMKFPKPDLDEKTLKDIKVKDPVEYGHLTQRGFDRKSSSLAQQPPPYPAGRNVHRLLPHNPDEVPFRTGYEKNWHHMNKAMPPNRNPSKWTGTGTTSHHFHTRKPMNNPNVQSTVPGVYYEQSGYTRSTKKDKSSPVEGSFLDPLEMLKTAEPEVVALVKKQHSYLFEERPVEKKNFDNYAYPRLDCVVVD